MSTFNEHDHPRNGSSGEFANKSHSEPEAELHVPGWATLLREYPTAPGDVQAVPDPEWSDPSADLAGISPKGTERAVARYQACESERLHADARLEGFAYTLPDIQKLMRGEHVAGHTVGEVAQLEGMRRASEFMLNRVREAGEPLEPSQSLSDGIHSPIALPLGLIWDGFRGEQDERYMGPLVQLDRGERFRALDARLMRNVLAAGLHRIAQQDHPLARAATWAAFSAYQQFYFDGNKRTGRLVMNAVAMSHGFDSILIPDSLKSEYEDVVVEALRTGNLDAHVRFLLARYDDA